MRQELVKSRDDAVMLSYNGDDVNLLSVKHPSSHVVATLPYNESDEPVTTSKDDDISNDDVLS